MVTTGTGPLIPRDQFHKLLVAAFTDERFRSELALDGFGVLERHGFDVRLVPDDVRSALARSVGAGTSRPRCGVCGVCGVCTLCAEIDAGSGAAALWALFFIENTA